MSGKNKKSDIFNFLDEESSKRILLMDGAMGTMIQKYKFEEKPDKWVQKRQNIENVTTSAKIN